jgi:DNA-binding transcriptional MocR family regulator
MAEIVVRLIHSGDLMRQVLLKREVAASRNAIANDVLCNWLPVFSKAPGFHRWLPLPAGRSSRLSRKRLKPESPSHR